jgi:hypothetical protein
MKGNDRRVYLYKKINYFSSRRAVRGKLGVIFSLSLLSLTKKKEFLGYKSRYFSFSIAYTRQVK